MNSAFRFIKQVGDFLMTVDQNNVVQDLQNSSSSTSVDKIWVDNEWFTGFVWCGDKIVRGQYKQFPTLYDSSTKKI